MKKLSMNLFLILAAISSFGASASHAFSVFATREGDAIKMNVTAPIQKACGQTFNFVSIAVKEVAKSHYVLNLSSTYVPLNGRNLCINFQANASLTLWVSELLPNAFNGEVILVDVSIDKQPAGSFSYNETEVLRPDEF